MLRKIPALPLPAGRRLASSAVSESPGTKGKSVLPTQSAGSGLQAVADSGMAGNRSVFGRRTSQVFRIPAPGRFNQRKSLRKNKNPIKISLTAEGSLLTLGKGFIWTLFP